MLGAADSELDRLLQSSRRGDSDAWNRLVQELQGLVYSVPHRYRLTDEDAADVFIATFESLYMNLDRILSGSALPKWVATTAARECLRLIRINSTVRSEITLEEVIATEEAGAEKDAIEFDVAFRLRRAVQQMPAKCRDLLTALYFEDDPTYTEISERLHIPVGAIGPTRARCQEKLRQRLVKEGLFE